MRCLTGRETPTGGQGGEQKKLVSNLISMPRENWTRLRQAGRSIGFRRPADIITALVDRFEATSEATRPKAVKPPASSTGWRRTPRGALISGDRLPWVTLLKVNTATQQRRERDSHAKPTQPLPDVAFAFPHPAHRIPCIIFWMALFWAQNPAIEGEFGGMLVDMTAQISLIIPC
jgi:hypothetical protein